MIKLYCDVCGKYLDDADNAHYLKMWSLSFASSSLTAGNLDEFSRRKEILVCPECMEKIQVYVEELG